MFNCETCGQLVRPEEVAEVHAADAPGMGPRTRAFLRTTILLLLLVGAVGLLLWVDPGGLRGRLYDGLMETTYAVLGRGNADRPAVDVRSAIDAGPAVDAGPTIDARPTIGDAGSAAAASDAALAGTAGPNTAAPVTARSSTATASTEPGTAAGPSRATLPKWLEKELKLRGIYAYVSASKEALVIRSPQCGTNFLPRLEATPELYGAIGAAGFRSIECRSASGPAEVRDVMPVIPSGEKTR